MKATITLLDEINCNISGISERDRNMLWEQHGVFADGYFFQPSYKMGRWDGKLRFFQKNGNTYSYLLEDIIPTLSKQGYKISINDRRDDVPNEFETFHNEWYAHIENEEGESIVFRDYQVDAINALIEAGQGLCIAATSAGKTFITGGMCDIMARKGYRTIVIVPSADLVVQTKTEFELLQLDVGEYSGSNKDIDHNTVVSTWQALKNNATLLKQFQCVIVDECHGAKGRVIQDLLNHAGSHIPFRFGVTGTLPKAESDKLTVHCTLGPILYKITAKQLMDEGYVSKLHIDILQLHENLKTEYENYKQDANSYGDKVLTYNQFTEQYLPDYQAEKSYTQGNQLRTNHIANMIENYRNKEQGNAFVLVNSIRYGKQLAKLIPNSHFINGKDKKEVRKQAYDLFHDNDNVVVIATYSLASTGINIKRIFHLFCVDPGKSYVRVIQSIGRSLRKAHDKDNVKVIELCSNLKYSKRHLAERIKYYQESSYEYTKKKVQL